MDNTTSYCLNPRCGLFGKVGPAARLKRYDWQRAGPWFECKACGSVLSASTGTAAMVRTPSACGTTRTRPPPTLPTHQLARCTILSKLSLQCMVP